MAGRRLLLMHVTTSSGHHHASQAIAHAAARLDPTCQAINVDAFDFTTRITRWAIMRSYMSVIRHHPDVWEYLYDNPDIHRHIRHFRQLLHRYHAHKLRRLLETVQPQAIACTQAFPCGMLADFMMHDGLHIPIVGVLTDYAPHVYWMHDAVDYYIVSSEAMKERFVSQGVPEARMRVYGIPVEPRFLDPVDREAAYRQFGLDAHLPVVMVMGGGGGFGPIRELVRSLDRVTPPCQFVVLTGTNQLLLAWLRRQPFRHRIAASGYTDLIPDLMEISTLIITKPGGLTTAESLAKHLPLMIVSPIPGQELCNARFLLAEGAAAELGDPHIAGEVLSRLLRDQNALQRMREHAARLAHPDSALRTAELLFELADQSRQTAALVAGASG